MKTLYRRGRKGWFYALQGATGNIAASSGVVSPPGVAAEAPSKVAGCDAGEANVITPGFWWVSGKGSCVRMCGSFIC